MNNGHRYVNGRDSASCSDPKRIACLNGGIHLANSSGADIYGNTVSGNANAIALVEFTRDQSTVPWTIPSTQNNHVHDNVITIGPNATGVRQYGGPPGYDATRANNRFTNNTYHLQSPTGAYFWWNSLLTRQQWQAAGHDTTGRFLSP